MLEQIVTTGGIVKSYEIAARLLGALAEVRISVRHVGALTRQIGQELAAAETARTEAYRRQPLPRVATRLETPIELACVACDGGRMQTRRAHCGAGVHDAHWRETKNAGFFPHENAVARRGPASAIAALLRESRASERRVVGLGNDRRSVGAASR